MYKTLGREGEPVMAIGTKPICESDRNVHWSASENLFIPHNNTLFNRNFDALSRKTIWKYMIFVFLQN